MARRCFQEGCVFKRGRRKKVWVEHDSFPTRSWAFHPISPIRACV
jgi:hypothetical protein